MLNLSKNEQYGVAINALAGYVSLLVIGYGQAFWALRYTGRNYAMPSWAEVAVTAAMPLLLACLLAAVIPAFSKWNRQPSSRLTVFFTVIWSYLALEIVRMLLSAGQNLYGITIPTPVFWIIAAVIANIAAMVTWKGLYTQKPVLRAKIAVFTAITMLLYIALPLVEHDAWRLTYAIGLY